MCRTLLSWMSLVLLSAGSLPGQDAPPGGVVKSVADLPPGWILHETANYQVQTECDLAVARTVGIHLERISRCFRQIFPFPKRGQNPKRQAVKVFRNRETYLAYGAPADSVAFYRPGTKHERELVAYFDIAADGISDQAEVTRTLYHEAWHQYLRWAMKEDEGFPIWIDEGIAEYFFAVEVDEKKGQITPGGINRWRLRTVQEAIRSEGVLPFERLVLMGRSEYQAAPSFYVAQAWSLVHFMLHSRREYRDALMSYLYTFEEKGDAEKAYDAAFRRLDLPMLASEWREFVLGLPSDPPGEEGEQAPGDGEGER